MPGHAARTRLSLAAALVAMAGVAVGQEPPTVEPPPGSLSAQPVAPPPPPPADPNAKYRLDKGSLMLKGIEDDAPVRSLQENRLEYDAYNHVLLFARQFSAAELEAAARRDVTLADLIKPVRADFQFDLVYFEGRLRRMRKVEPTKVLADAGVPSQYEAWVFPDGQTNPICVHVTDLPPGLEPAMDYPPNLRVGIAGYAFKLMRYESGEADKKNPGRNVWRKAPFLMGRSFTVLPGDGRPTMAEVWRTEFLPLLLGLIAVAAGSLFTLTWFFRHGDRRTRAVLDARRSGTNPFTEPNA